MLPEYGLGMHFMYVRRYVLTATRTCLRECDRTVYIYSIVTYARGARPRGRLHARPQALA